MPASEAEDELHACFANRAWAARVASGRPYPNLEMLFAAAEEAWSELSAGDWLRAFAAHPRIGEVGGHAQRLRSASKAGSVRRPPRRSPPWRRKIAGMKIAS